MHIASLGRRPAILAGLAAALAFSAPAAAAPAIGQPAPEFSVVDTGGVARSLTDLRGKVVVLEWTNADCPFVAKHYRAANMQALQKRAAAEGVVWLSVISSAPGEQGHVDAAEADRLTQSRDAAPSGVVLDPDGRLGRAYGAVTTPHMYVIDGAGTLRYMGGIDSIGSTRAEDLAKAEPLFLNAMQAVVGGREVAQPLTRPYGCAVKYKG